MHRQGLKTLISVIIMIIAGMLFIAPNNVMAIGTVAGTQIVNQAYIDYKDANKNPMTRQWSNPVVTVVSQVAAVSNTPGVTQTDTPQGTQAVYPITVTNNGNGNDTFVLTVNNPDGWPVTIYKDLDNDGVLDPGEKVPTNIITDTGVLPPDGTFNILVVVDVPPGTPDGTQSATTVTSTSQFDPTVKDTTNLTTTAQDAVMAALKTYDPSSGIKPGDVLTYTVNIANNGSTTAENVVITDPIPSNTTYVAGSMRKGPTGGTYIGATIVTDDGTDGDGAEYNNTSVAVIISLGNMAPNASTVIYFQVEVNSGVPQGTTISNNARINYDVAGNPQPPYTSPPAQFPVSYLPGVNLTPDQNKSGNPGDNIVYPVTVENLGNATDTINITYTNPDPAWLVTFWKDVNNNNIVDPGDTPLIDTGTDTIIDTGQIPQNGSIQILVIITVPVGAPDKVTNNVVVTGTSIIDPKPFDSVTLTSTVTAPVVSITKVVNPVGDQPPQTELTYTITAINSGTGNATDIVITDAIPANTTYKTGTMKAGSVFGSLSAMTDTDTDGDGAFYDGTRVVVAIPLLNAGATFYVQITVTIN